MLNIIQPALSMLPISFPQPLYEVHTLSYNHNFKALKAESYTLETYLKSYS